MPRGRAGLVLIGSDEVARAVLSGVRFDYYRSPYRARRIEEVAERFGVAPRTVRRWLAHGLALGYGANNPTRDEWEAFARDPASDKFRSKPVTGEIRRVTGLGR